MSVGENLLHKIATTHKGKVGESLRGMAKNDMESIALKLPFRVGYFLHIYNCQVDFYKQHQLYVVNFVHLNITNTLIENKVKIQNVYIAQKMQELYDYVNRTKDFRNLEIKKLSRQFGINAQTLKTEFKKRYHQSIYQYFMLKRMERCLLLMQTTPLNLKEISNQTGFNSYKSFHANFIKFYGMSPTRYKRE